MKNVYLAYEVITPARAATDDIPAEGEMRVAAQAYIKADDHKEAEEKLAAFLGKKEYHITQFAEANAEIIV